MVEEIAKSIDFKSDIDDVKNNLENANPPDGWRELIHAKARRKAIAKVQGITMADILSRVNAHV